jgi:predicted regulator of Ras-like GTPase activity (Roadblock/LC7/MglB family)
VIERARTALGELARVRGVRAAMLASESDGMAAASVASVGVAEDALAAFAMALFRRARMANAAAGYGATRFLALDAAHGRLYVAARGDLGVIVLGEPDANTGLIRVLMQRALGGLE